MVLLGSASCRLCLSLVLAAGFVASGLSAESVRSPERVAYLQERLMHLEGGSPSAERAPESPEEISEESTAEAAGVLKQDATLADERESSPTEVLATGWQNAAAWDRVEVGMSTAQVEAILGRPAKVVASFHKSVDFVYHYEARMHRWSGQMRGQVSFSGDAVSALRRPEF